MMCSASINAVLASITGEPSAYAREHHHSHDGREAPPSMFWTVAVLAVLSVVGGWIQFAGVWTPVTSWLDPVARPLAEASGTKEAISSVLAVVLGVLGVSVAGWIYAARRAPAPRPLALFERKFYFDELYDLLFYRPSVALTRLFTGAVEKPLIGGTIAGAGIVAREAGEETARAQTGLLRTYAFAIAGSVAVLAVVFLSVR